MYIVFVCTLYNVHEYIIINYKQEYHSTIFIQDDFFSSVQNRTKC